MSAEGSVRDATQITPVSTGDGESLTQDRAAQQASVSTFAVCAFAFTSHNLNKVKMKLSGMMNSVAAGENFRMSE